MNLVGFSAKNHPQQVSANGARDAVDDRETPAEIFDPLHGAHRFTLDVAASEANRKCSHYFTCAQDGLRQDWYGRVWCNPPYSSIGEWVWKAWKEMLGGRSELVVMLLPANRTEQKWWQEHVEPCRDGAKWENGVSLSVRFLPGRPRFYRPSGKLGGPRGDRPPFGLCLLTWEAVA